MAVKDVLGKIGLPIMRRPEPLHAQLGKCLRGLTRENAA